MWLVSRRTSAKRHVFLIQFTPPFQQWWRMRAELRTKMADKNGGEDVPESTVFDLEAVQAQMCSSVEEDEAKLVQLFVLLQNYFRALPMRVSGEQWPPRYALENYGFGAVEASAISTVVAQYKWSKAPTWGQLKAAKGVLKCRETSWQIAAQMGPESWDSFPSHDQSQEERESPPRYEISDFLGEIKPEWDAELEKQFQDIQDQNVKKAMMWTEVQNRKFRLESQRAQKKIFEMLVTLSQSRQMPKPNGEFEDNRTGNFHQWMGESGRSGRVAEVKPAEDPSERQGGNVQDSVRRQRSAERNWQPNQSRLAEAQGSRKQPVNHQPVLAPQMVGNRRDRSPSENSRPGFACEEGSRLNLAYVLQDQEEAVREFLQVSREAIPIPNGVDRDEVAVPEPFSGEEPKDWYPFKMKAEMYLASRKAVTVSKQSRLLLGCFSGPMAEEYVEKLQLNEGQWFNLADYWVQLDKRFNRGRRIQHPSDPERWMFENPWDGNEWTLENFFASIEARCKNLIPRASGEAVSQLAARMIMERGLPSELLRELHAKIRADETKGEMQYSLDVLLNEIKLVFKEYANCQAEIPWNQRDEREIQTGKSRGYFSENNIFLRSREPFPEFKSSGQIYQPRAQGRGPFYRKRWPAKKTFGKNKNYSSPFQQVNEEPDFARPQKNQFKKKPENVERDTGGSGPENVLPNQPSSSNQTTTEGVAAPKRPSCNFCKKRGHVEEDCWNKYPEKRPQKQKPPFQSLGEVQELRILEKKASIEEKEEEQRYQAPKKSGNGQTLVMSPNHQRNSKPKPNILKGHFTNLSQFSR